MLRKNVSVVALAYAAGGAAGFAAQAVLARRLGGATFGVYIAALSLARLASVLNEIGSMDHFVREAARDRRRIEEGIGALLVLKTILGAGLVAISAVSAAALGFARTGVVVAVLLALMIAADRISDVFRTGLQAIERLELTCAISIGISVLSAAGMIAGVAAGWGVVGAVALSTTVSLAAIPISWLVLRRYVRLSMRTSAAAALRVARESLPFAVAGFFLFGITYVDILVVRGSLGEGATGLYGAASRIIVVLGFIAMVVDNSLYRSLSFLAHRSSEAFARAVNRAAAGLLVIAIPLAVGGSFVAARVLTLAFGASYASGSGAFRILLWSLPFAFPGVVLVIALLNLDSRAAGWILGVAFAGNLVANIVLVPRYGIAAAAWTTVATQAVVTIAAATVLARAGVPARWPAMAAPALGAAGLMVPVVLATRNLPLGVPIVAGVATYVCAVLAMGVLDRLGLPRLRAPWRPAQVAGIGGDL